MPGSCAFPRRSPTACPCWATTAGCCSPRGTPGSRWSPTVLESRNPKPMPVRCCKRRTWHWRSCRWSGSTPAATGSGWAVAGTIEASHSSTSTDPRRPPGWWAPGSRCSKSKRSRANPGTSRSTPSAPRHALSWPEPHEQTQALLVDEIRTGGFFDRRPGTRRHRAVDRGAQLPGAQLHAPDDARGRGAVLPLQYRGAGDLRPRRGREPSLSGPHSVRAQVEVPRPQGHPGTTALGAGGRRLRAPPAPADPARGDPRPCRRPRRGLCTDPQGFAPVRAAGHRRAVEVASFPGVTRMSDAKRLAGEKAIEHVEDGMVVGVGTGSTVAYFIDALGRIRHRIAGVVSSSEQSSERLRAHGIEVMDLNDTGPLQLYVDGADECDPANC